MSADSQPKTSPAKTSAPSKGKKRVVPVDDEPVKDAPVEKKPKVAKPSKKSAPKASDDDEAVEKQDDGGGEEPVLTVADLIDSFVKQRQEQQAFHKSELDILRNIKKAYKKEIRVLAKSRSKKTRKGSKREPSGIATQKYISPELCAFMGEKEGTRLPRTFVTKFLHNYVKEKKLLGREGHFRKDGELNQQYITPDETLKKLIGDPPGLNFFSLQTALNPHFVDPSLQAVANP